VVPGTLMYIGSHTNWPSVGGVFVLQAYLFIHLSITIGSMMSDKQNGWPVNEQKTDNVIKKLLV